jgi:hypothetical protein
MIVIAAAVLIPAIAIAKQMDPVQYAIEQLHDGARCDDKTAPLRYWCVADGFRDATTAPLPTRTLVGFTIELGPNADARDALANNVTLSALAIGADHKVNLVAITPANDAERAAIAGANASIAHVLARDGNAAPLPPAIARRVAGLTGKYEPVASSAGWQWTAKNSVELAAVGPLWVAVELGPRPPIPHGARHQPFGTIWISVLTDAWK